MSVKQVAKLVGKIPNLQVQTKNDEAKEQKRRTRTRFTPKQIVYMERLYKYHPYLTSTDYDEFVEELQLPESKIRMWFNNRRMRDKKLMSKEQRPKEDSLAQAQRCPTPPNKQTNISSSKPTLSLPKLDDTDTEPCPREILRSPQQNAIIFHQTFPKLYCGHRTEDRRLTVGHLPNPQVNSIYAQASYIRFHSIPNDYLKRYRPNLNINQQHQANTNNGDGNGSSN